MRYQKLENTFGGQPGVSIQGSLRKKIYFSKQASDILQLSVGDVVAFRCWANNKLHIAVCPITECHSGGTVFISYGRFSVGILLKYHDAFTSGKYILSEPFYANGIDWYELVPFNK